MLNYLNNGMSIGNNKGMLTCRKLSFLAFNLLLEKWRTRIGDPKGFITSKMSRSRLTLDPSDDQ